MTDLPDRLCVDPDSPFHDADLLAKGIGVDVMDTAAACRTYNIIMLEGRRVASTLLGYSEKYTSEIFRKYMGLSFFRIPQATASRQSNDTP